MSLVTTVVSQQITVQVSDTRVTWFAPNTAPPNERQRKSLVVSGTNARFVLGWVGTATLKGCDTGAWLFKHLCSMDAKVLPVESIISNLITLANPEFSSLPFSPENRRCSFVLGGWHKPSGTSLEPFIGGISNYVTPKLELHALASPKHSHTLFEESPVAAPEFKGWIEHFKEATDEHFLVNVMGDANRKQLETYLVGLRKLLKKNRTAEAVSTACRQLTLKAADQSDTIGRNLIAVEMDTSGLIRRSYYPEIPTDESALIADILSAEISSTQLTVQSEITEDGHVNVRVRGKVAR